MSRQYDAKQAVLKAHPDDFDTALEAVEAAIVEERAP